MRRRAEGACAGLKVALLEKTAHGGGLATTGLINIYTPALRRYGRQVLFGRAEEFLHESARYGPGDVPAQWRQSPVDGQALSLPPHFLFPRRSPSPWTSS